MKLFVKSLIFVGLCLPGLSQAKSVVKKKEKNKVFGFYKVADPGSGPFRVEVASGELIRAHKGKAFKRGEGFFHMSVHQRVRNLEVNITGPDSEEAKIYKYRGGAVRYVTRDVESPDFDLLKDILKDSKGVLRSEEASSLQVSADSVPKWAVYRKPRRLRRIDRKIRRILRIQDRLENLEEQLNEKEDRSAKRSLKRLKKRALRLDKKIKKLQAKRAKMAKKSKWVVRRHVRFPLHRVENFNQSLEMADI